MYYRLTVWVCLDLQISVGLAVFSFYLFRTLQTGPKWGHFVVNADIFNKPLYDLAVTSEGKVNHTWMGDFTDF